MTIPHALPISTLQHFFTSRGTLVQHPEHFRLVSPRIPFPRLAHSRHTFSAHLVLQTQRYFLSAFLKTFYYFSHYE